MSNIGNLILNLTGNKDPRDQLVAAIAGGAGAPATPVAGGATPGAAGGGAGAGAGAAPAAPPVAPAAATASPPDLLQLYAAITKRDERTSAINRGLGLMASAFAQPENRDRVAGAFDGGGTDSSAMINNLMTLRNSQLSAEKEATAARMATASRQFGLSQLPAISRRTGIPEAELRILLDNGQLDDVLKNSAEQSMKAPEYETVVDAATGQTIRVNKSNPNDIVPVGGAKPTEMKVVTDGTGQPLAYDPQNPAGTAQPFGAAKPVTPQYQADGAGNVFQISPDGTAVPFGKNAANKLQVMEDGTGQKYAYDPVNPVGTMQPIGAPAPVRMDTFTDGTGQTFMYNPQNPQGGMMPVGAPKPQEDKRTGNEKDFDRDMIDRSKRGEPVIPYKQWLDEDANRRKPVTQVNTNVNTGDYFKDGFGKTYVDDYTSADAGKQVIASIGNAYNTLEKGIVSGSALSPYEFEGRKILGSMFGLSDDQVANTAAFQSATREIVLPKVKSLGTGNSISNADRDFIEQQVGASLNIPKEAAQEILGRMERLSREGIIQYNKNIDALVAANPNVAGQVRRIDLPPPSAALLWAITDGKDAFDVNGAVNYMKANPNDVEAKKKFDAKAGTGMADYFLGAQ